MGVRALAWVPLMLKLESMDAWVDPMDFLWSSLKTSVANRLARLEKKEKKNPKMVLLFCVVCAVVLLPADDQVYLGLLVLDYQGTLYGG